MSVHWATGFSSSGSGVGIIGSGSGTSGLLSLQEINETDKRRYSRYLNGKCMLTIFISVSLKKNEAGVRFVERPPRIK